MSARKRTILLSIGCLALIIALGFDLLLFFHKNDMSTAILKSGNRRYTLQIATTLAEQYQGLGGRAVLPQNQGMLFPFDGTGVRCFWMKGMQFPLDMVWVSSNKQVLYVQAGVSPHTYPHVFCPNVPAEYVLELNAGQARQAAIHTGESLSF